MPSKIRAMLKGAVAGAAGTLAMDLLWFGRYRSGGGTQAFIPWESSEGTDGYDQAAAPARTAKAIADLVGVELPDRSARTVNNAVHWLTGLAWGQAHGLAASVVGSTNPVLGLGTAVLAWGTSYAVLPRLGVYEQIGEYEPEVLWQDLSAHLVFGAVLGLGFRVMSSRS